ncbi:hypothetical protein WN944_015063 [Citrus x changshan-huyou]|uniref:chitinase n=1 Tax=Citrus x changshan-huyou TaxID=2935761 RepID=A0AAP0MBS4_9ROSI
MAEVIVKLDNLGTIPAGFSWWSDPSPEILSYFHYDALAENEQCGKQAGGALCPNDDCCSKDGFCGITATYCGEGCQRQCHHLSSFLDQSTFDEVFPNQNSSNCPSQGFYTYDALINAAKSFSGFASVGDDGTRKSTTRKMGFTDAKLVSVITFPDTY